MYMMFKCVRNARKADDENVRLLHTTGHGLNTQFAVVEKNQRDRLWRDGGTLVGATGTVGNASKAISI